MKGPAVYSLLTVPLFGKEQMETAGMKSQTLIMNSEYPLVSHLSNLKFVSNDFSVGELQLKGKSLYFAKAIHDKEIAKHGTNDNEVMFGEVSGMCPYL